MLRKISFILALALCIAFRSTAAEDPGVNSGGEASKQDRTPSVSGKMDFQTDIFTGRFGYTVPIQVAPGRHGSEPKLALRYNSGNAESWCGHGWELELGYIQRETRKGVPVKWSNGYPLKEYDDGKGYVFNFGGEGSALVNVTDGQFRAEIEGSFLRFQIVTNSTTNYWLVTDKSGNKYYFGQTSNSRMSNTKTGWPSSDGRGTFRWALSRIETVNGDISTITYTTDGGNLYPQVYSYNGHTAGLTNTHTVEFQIGDRSDKTFSYATGYRVDTAKRLTNILVKVSGSLVRRYQIGYTTSTSTLRSLITSVTIYGANGTSALPALTFDYTDQVFQFQSQTNWTNLFLPFAYGIYNMPYYGDATGLKIDLVDANGDGLPDRVITATNGATPWTNFLVQPNTGTGFDGVFSWAIASQGRTNVAHWSVINSAYTRFLDINGDGLPDRVMDPKERYETESPYTNLVVELNNGAGFDASVRWTNVTPSNPGGFPPIPSFLAIENSGLVKMIDMNGDGLPDRVMLRYDTTVGPYTNFWIQFNTGAGFSSPHCFGPYSSQGQTAHPGWSATESDLVRLIDINGDGLPDRVMKPYAANMGDYKYFNSFTNYIVEYNNGYGFETAAYWPGVDPQYIQVVPGTTTTNTTSLYCAVSDSGIVALRDINGDGLPDRIMRTHYAPYTNWLVQLNTGAGFAPVRNFGPYYSQNRTYAEDYSAISSELVTLIDINGDGLPDRVMTLTNSSGRANENFMVVELSKGPYPDLLHFANNGIGGSITVSYKCASQFDNRQSTSSMNARRLLPFPFYAATTVTLWDGLYGSAATSYAYEGGMWSSARREFNGFSKVNVSDPLGVTNIYYFYQAGGRDNLAKGEYQDTTNNFGKRGIPCRIETYGTNGGIYKTVVNKVEEATLAGGSHFPYISQTMEYEYPGGWTGTRSTAKQFIYDTTTGNLTNTINYGEVTDVHSDTHSFTNVTGDELYQVTTFAALSNTNILDKPQRQIITSDAARQNILREALFDYDGATGNLLVQRDRSCDSCYRTNSFSYDSYKNRQTATDAAGVTTAYLYDSSYQTLPRQQIIDTGYTNTFQYDPSSGLLLSITDAKGLVTSNAYDTFKRITNTWISTTPNGPAQLWVARYLYGLGPIDANHVPGNYIGFYKNDGVDAANGHTTWCYYDGFGRLLQIRIEAEANGFRVTDTIYNKVGDIRFQTLPYFSASASYGVPSGYKAGTSRDYDPIGRLARINTGQYGWFGSDGTLTNTTRLTDDSGSPMGNLSLAYADGSNPWALVRTDEESKVRKYLLDAYGRTNQVIEVTSQGSYTNTLRWDKMGLLTNIVDHYGNSIEYAYNDLGELVAMADPNMGVWQYRRDNAGRIREQVDANNQLVRFNYDDPLGRLRSKQVYNAQGGFVYGITNVYDSSDDPGFTVYRNQIYKVIDSEGWQKYSYDVRGRTLKTARYLSKNSQTYVTQFAYDDADRIKAITYPQNGPIVTNVYDSGGNISQVKRVDGGTVYYQARGFDALGQLAGITFGNSVITTNEYFPISKRLKKTVTYKSGSTNIQSLTYTYDKVANVKSITDAVYTTGAACATLSSVTYDDLHRLTSLNSTSQGIKNYSYSPIGNITANGEGDGVAYDYGTRKPHAVKSANGKNYAYDFNGNMLARGNQRFDYDPLNRLSSVSTNGIVIASFGYGANDERLWKQGPNGLQIWIGDVYEEKGGQILFHVQAGSRRVCTFDSTGTNVLEYYHPDHLRSTSILTDGSGNRIQHYEYSAYGRDRYTESSIACPPSKRFTSQIFEEDIGIYFYESRYYDPELARFIQPDTIIPDIGNPQSYNRYTYVYNNPLKYTDPSGHSPVDYIPGLGPGLAKIQGAQALDKAAQRLGERNGRGWIDYNDAVRDLGIGKGTATAGNLQAISGMQDITGAAAEGYLMGVQEIATAGIATVAAPRVANKIAEGTSGWWSRLKSWVKGRGSKSGSVTENTTEQVVAEGGAKLLPQFAKSSVDEMIATAAQRGIKLTEHGAERLLGRESGVTLDMIERTLQKGSKYLDAKNNSIVYVLEKGMASGKDMAVAVDPATGVIRTIMTNPKIVRPRFQPIP